MHIKRNLLQAGVCLTAFVLSITSASAADWQTPLMWDWIVGTASPTLSAQAAEIADLQAENATRQAEIDSLTTQLTAIESYVQQLQAYVEVDTTTDPQKPVVRVVAANMQVVNGLGDNLEVNGVGNLLVGYDSVRPSGPVLCPCPQVEPFCSVGQYIDEASCIGAGEVWANSHKSGSHNVVIGRYHSYSQNGGLLAGVNNVANAPHATVVGGQYNYATGVASVVGGGTLNNAAGSRSTVSGGAYNEAVTNSSSISGGRNNIATGYASSVSGGKWNTAAGDYSSVTGGELNVASGDDSSVSAGWSNEAAGPWSAVSGGAAGFAGGQSSNISGGNGRSVAVGTFHDWVAGALFQDN
jgi:hypothetical protein